VISGQHAIRQHRFQSHGGSRTSLLAQPTHGLVELNVQTIKRLFKKAHDKGKDTELVLLEFRNTPITGLDESPAKLLMSRRLRTHMPTIPTLLKPTISEGIRERLTHQKQKRKEAEKSLPDLAPGDGVRYRVEKTWKPAIVIKGYESPRSYYIQTHHGTVIRRNRYHLK